MRVIETERRQVRGKTIERNKWEIEKNEAKTGRDSPKTEKKFYSTNYLEWLIN